MKNTFLILIFTAGIIHFSFAQFGFEFNDSLPVVNAGDTLDNPWAGGLNYTQLSDFDFDFDGDQDLLAFDRSSNNIRVMLQEGSGSNKYYRIFYNAEAYFPAGIRYRAMMVDYDMDGRDDLFTTSPGGISVYRNIGDAQNGLQWELAEDLIYSQYHNLYSNLLVSSSDIPAIVDVDFDGDIDILTFDQSGQHMEYHQNQSMEMYGIPDSLIFEQKNQCWGKFEEDVNTNSIMLNDPNPPCVGGDISNPQKSAKHAGSTVLALDYDNSGVLDLVLGDVSFPNLNLLINGGTAPNTDSPMISVDNAFPSNTTPANMQLFPAAFFLDVDFDGVKDLVVGANARNVSRNVSSLYFYKNHGSNALPNFIYTQDNLLQQDMIEHGSGSIPVFTDINEDGLDDLIVANYYRYKPTLSKESTLAYYQNTGTANNPVLTFVDDDYLNLTNESYGLRVIPTFGDLDDDGDNDLLLGTENGSLVYFENTSTGSGAIYSNPTLNYTDDQGQMIDHGTFGFPQLFDLDNDGLLDLIIGKRTGELVYYRNIGTANNPSFQLTNDNLGMVDVSTDNPDGYAAPHFFRHDNETFLFIGDFEGRMNYFSNIDGNLNPTESFTSESNNFLGISTQAFSSFWVNDLNGDTDLELYVGQDLGGIYRFEADSNSTVSIGEIDLPDVDIFPNPALQTVTVSTGNIQAHLIQLIAPDGKIIVTQQPNSTQETIDISHLPQGVYFVTISWSNGQFASKKLIKR